MDPVPKGQSMAPITYRSRRTFLESVSLRWCPGQDKLWTAGTEATLQVTAQRTISHQGKGQAPAGSHNTQGSQKEEKDLLKLGPSEVCKGQWDRVKRKAGWSRA